MNAPMSKGERDALVCAFRSAENELTRRLSRLAWQLPEVLTEWPLDYLSMGDLDQLVKATDELLDALDDARDVIEDHQLEDDDADNEEVSS